VVPIYVAGALAFILAGAMFRARREPERARLVAGFAVALSIAVVVGAWLVNGMRL
jgi:hypothetical protein